MNMFRMQAILKRMEEEEEPQIRNILVEFSKKIPTQKAIDFLHSLATSKNILFWTPRGEMVYHDRRSPVTNIAQLIEYVLLPYSQDVVKPRALNAFLEGLAELKIDKSLIKNKKLVMDIIVREKENNRSEESIQYNTIQYFINPFLLDFSGLIYIRPKIELNISNKIITMCY